MNSRAIGNRFLAAKAGDRDDQALADVAEHVAEHQRHREREQHRWIGFVARRHAERAAEDFERAGPTPGCRAAAAPSLWARGGGKVQQRTRTGALERLAECAAPEKSLVQPVIQQKRSPDSSARTFWITHCSRLASARADVQIVLHVERLELRAQSLLRRARAPRGAARCSARSRRRPRAATRARRTRGP